MSEKQQLSPPEPNAEITDIIVFIFIGNDILYNQ